MAGTIAAVGNNSKGVVGVAYSSKIFPIRVFNEYGVATVSIINALNSAVANGARVINLSLGGPFYSDLESQTYDSLYQLGIVVIASAGNEGVSDLSYPAGYPSVMAVGATDQNDNLSYFSNYGQDWVSVAAPGEQILSTFSYRAYRTCLAAFSTSCLEGPVLYLDNNATFAYALSGGTSMAAPHVSGLAALLLSYSSEFTNEEVYGIISSTTDPLSGGQAIMNGRINAASALGYALELKANRAIDRNFDYSITDNELLTYAWNVHRYDKYYYEYLDINNDGKYDLNDIGLIHTTVIDYLDQADYNAFFEHLACLRAVDLQYDAFISNKERLLFRKRINALLKKGKYSSIYDVDSDGIVNSSDMSLIISTFSRLGIVV